MAIDLLYDTASTRVSVTLIDRALVFAFSAGDTAGAFEKVLENAGCGESCFAPECFAHDLFVDQFIERCLPVRAAGKSFIPCKPYLRRAITQPPRDSRDTRFRQTILAELWSNSSFRTDFETLYVALHDLRTLLSTADYSTRVDQNVRRLDILKSLALVFQIMARSFDGAESGLGRIHEAGQRITASRGYQALSELLDHESHRATVDLRLRLGIDGTVRNFAVVRYHESPGNRLHVPFWRRLFGRVMMLLRGQRVSQHDLLRRLMDQVFDGVRGDVLPLFQLLGDIEFHLASLGMADMAQRAGLQMCFPCFIDNESGPSFSVSRLFNPFLLAEGVDLRPCDVEAGSDAIVIITGPNSGGKTRLLQSVALCQVLGQSGMMVPAAKAQLHWTRGLFVSLIDDVSADQHEGRLGMELMRIRRLFEQINVGDMVVIDELCSGTNPSEGEEIFRLVIQLLGELHSRVWLTTHFLSFAERLRDQPPLPQLSFFQVKLDSRDVPTFEFCEGVAKTSLARQTAARLGVTWEELTLLVERAKHRHHKGSHSISPNSDAFRLDADAAWWPEPITQRQHSTLRSAPPSRSDSSPGARAQDAAPPGGAAAQDDVTAPADLASTPDSKSFVPSTNS